MKSFSSQIKRNMGGHFACFICDERRCEQITGQWEW